MHKIINKKSFDYNNKSNFMNDNRTIGTSEYFQKKLGPNLPNDIYDMMEILTRHEYTTQDIIYAKEAMKQQRDFYSMKLLEELKERENDNLKYHFSNNILDKIKYKLL